MVVRISNSTVIPGFADQIGDGAGKGRMVEIESSGEESLRHTPPSGEDQSRIGAHEECAQVHEGLGRRR